jgi:hypothetical protein
MLRRKFRLEKKPKNILGRDSQSFPASMAANLVTTNLFPIIVGSVHPALVGAYSVIQQPSLLFAPISNAATTFLLPKFSREKLVFKRSRVATLILLIPLMLVVGAIAAVALTPFLGFIYASQEVSLLALVFVMCAGALGVFSSAASSAFIADGRGKTVSQLAILQGGLTVLEVAFLLFGGDVLTVAITDFAIRFIGVAFLAVKLQKQRL